MSTLGKFQVKLRETEEGGQELAIIRNGSQWVVIDLSDEQLKEVGAQIQNYLIRK